MRANMAALVVGLAMTGCATEEAGFPVRATLADGQVMLGSVQTETLRLVGALGEIAVPLDDVGEVVPVEGGVLNDADANVTVWLRNGSELRGRWAEPELAMGIAVGGSTVQVDLPMERLLRLQTQGGQAWSADVFRVRTTFGDDFLVDPERSSVTVTNDLGTFSPTLIECASLRPLGDPTGDWRIELRTGTVLIGPLDSEALVFALPMGPEEITVPLEIFAGVETEVWQPPPPAASPVSGSGGWFDNRPMQEQKQQYDAVRAVNSLDER